MKTLFVILVLVTSALAALFFTLDTPAKEKAPLHVPKKRTLYSNINDNFDLVRRISKEGDISEAKNFKIDSLRLIDEIKRKSLFSEKFVQDYTRLHFIINDTANAIHEHNDVLYTHLLKTKDRMQNFEKKLKSIGLSELNKNWRITQKLFRQFHREPNDEKHKRYLQHLDMTKTIITELYLDDDQEEYLFSYLDDHHNAFNSLYEVYNDVGFYRINELKPLIYGLKEQMALKSAQYDMKS